VLDALKALPVESPKYFFWAGAGQLICGINNVANTIKAVAKRAGVAGAHPHRFRDTFAVTLLQNGVGIHVVQDLLGHTSVETTRKHYSPFVKGSQDILDAATGTLDFVTQPA